MHKSQSVKARDSARSLSPGLMSHLSPSLFWRPSNESTRSVPQGTRKRNNASAAFPSICSFLPCWRGPHSFRSYTSCDSAFSGIINLTSHKLTLLLSLSGMNSIPGTEVHFLPKLRASCSSHKSISTHALENVWHR